MASIGRSWADLDGTLQQPVYGITGIPHLTLIDRDGVVAADNVSRERFLKEAEALLDRKPSALPDAAHLAALELERKYRVKGAPIPATEFQRLRAILPNTIWRPAELIEYFKAHHTPEQKAIAVLVKTGIFVATTAIAPAYGHERRLRENASRAHGFHRRGEAFGLDA